MQMNLIAGPIKIGNEAEMIALGQQMAFLFEAGDVILLDGDLGAGKTTLIRAILQAQAAEEIEVPSPTFSLVQSYVFPHSEIWHMDLYRLEQPDDIWELGVEEAFESAICFFEWPDKAKGLLPEDGLRIVISHSGNAIREVSFFSSDADRWRPRLLKVLN